MLAGNEAVTAPALKSCRNLRRSVDIGEDLASEDGLLSEASGRLLRGSNGKVISLQRCSELVCCNHGARLAMLLRAGQSFVFIEAADGFLLTGF